MWPAVPRIIACSLSQATVLPQLERAQRAAVGEMFGEEFAKQSLVGASGRVVEHRRVLSVDESAQRVARVGWKPAAGCRQPSAPEAQGAAGPVAEHHRILGRSEEH